MAVTVSSQMTTYDSLNDAARGLLSIILEHGSASAPRGLPTIEVCDFSFVLTCPRARLLTIPARRWSTRLAIGELCWHFSGSNSVKFIGHYATAWSRFSDDGITITGSAYGHRAFGANDGVSQWSSIVNLLRDDPASRRAVLVLAVPKSDLDRSRDIACITTVQFLVRNGSLDCVATLRSNDAYLGLGYDVFFLTMLQERLALELDIPLGQYHHHTASLHLYQQDVGRARDVVKDPTQGSGTMRPMTDLGSLPAFLATEVAIRTGVPSSQKQVRALPLYWRVLAECLTRADCTSVGI
jgi:thymidylate synthase